jgi:hypothetical protein
MRQDHEFNGPGGLVVLRVDQIADWRPDFIALRGSELFVHLGGRRILRFHPFQLCAVGVCSRRGDGSGGTESSAFCMFRSNAREGRTGCTLQIPFRPGARGACERCSSDISFMGFREFPRQHVTGHLSCHEDHSATVIPKVRAPRCPICLKGAASPSFAASLANTFSLGSVPELFGGQGSWCAIA